MNDTFKGGLDLRFVANAEFESLEGVPQPEHSPIIARNALRLITMGWPQESWKEFISWPILKTIFLYRDPVLLKEFRFAFQQGFELLFIQLRGKKLNAEQNEQVQLYISNCLSLLPYSDLTPFESIKIPQNIDNEWVLVEYHVTPVELTPTTGFKSYFMHDKDRVFAYGLEPISNFKAQSHLIFMGTTYPAGQGFVPQIETDLKGFETVGKSLYKSGEARIKQWILRQNGDIHVCGVSLGGSLSLLLAIHLGQYLKRVDALNPAGLHDGWYKSHYDQWDDLQIKPQVVVQQQANDPVSLLGIWKKGWQILWVNPQKDKKGPNPFCDHFMNYAGFAETEFTYVDPEQQNSNRRIRNFWLYSVGRSIVYYAMLVPYSYFIRPLLYSVAKNWLISSLFVISFATLGVLAAITSLATLPVIALLSVLVLSIAVGIPALTNYLSSQNAKEHIHRFANLHDPRLPRNPTMDIYNNDYTTEVELTYKQLNTYYRVMRCLVKNKEFLPSEDQGKQLGSGLLKREVLLASEQSEKHDELVRITTTKAKVVYIRQVLTLVQELNVQNEQELKHAVEQDYEAYRMGKYY